MGRIIHKYCAINRSHAAINAKVILENKEKLAFGKYIRSLYKHLRLDYSKFFKMDGLSKLGFMSVELLLQEETLLDKYPAEKIGIILFNASSSLEVDEKHQGTIIDREQYFPSPSNFVYTLPNIMGGEAAIRHKFKGENTIMISENFNAQLLYDICSAAFSTQALQICICGWVEKYREEYESVLFIVGREEPHKSVEGIIFDPSNISKLYKQEQAWRN